MITFANADAPHGALFDDAPALTLPDALKAQGWRLEQPRDLRTIAEREHDDVAELKARLDKLEAIVSSLLDDVTVMTDAEARAALGKPAQRQDEPLSPEFEARLKALEAAARTVRGTAHD